jgi:hypothetical protein
MGELDDHPLGSSTRSNAPSLSSVSEPVSVPAPTPAASRQIITSIRRQMELPGRDVNSIKQFTTKFFLRIVTVKSEEEAEAARAMAAAESERSMFNFN